MTYNVITTGSKGNCIIYKDIVMVDLGVKLKDRELITPYLDTVKIILLTHEHTIDHLQFPLLKWIVKNYPNIMIAYPDYLDEFILENMVEYNRKTKEYDPIIIKKKKVLDIRTKYNFGLFKLNILSLYHDVPNVGYYFTFADGYKIFHATDTHTLEGITIPSTTNLIGTEHHHIEEHYNKLIDDLKQERIDDPDNSKFIHEIGARNSHLSWEQNTEFLIRNKIENATVLRLHPSSNEYYKDIELEYTFKYEDYMTQE